jgi:hypothetical protein
MSHPVQTPARSQPRPPSGPSQSTGGTPTGGHVPLPVPPVASSPDLCGKAHDYKTTTGETRTKPCLKARNHSGGCSSRNTSARVDVSKVSADLLISEDAPTDEVLEQVQERTRSDVQKRLDARVAEGHAKWAAAGKLPGFNANIKAGAASRERCAPEHAVAVRAMLRRTESVNPGVHVRIMPPKNHVDGTVMLYWIAVDKHTKVSRATSAK